MSSSSAPSTESRRFTVVNLGCSKNQVDAEVIIASLKARGLIYREDDPGAADIIIVNTCGFIRSAKEESVNTVLHLTEAYPDKTVIAAGCLAERYRDELADSLPELAGVFGNRDPSLIGDILPGAEAGSHPVLIPDEERPAPHRNDFFGFDRSVYLKLAEGCDNNCHYCAIPLIRGGVSSRGRAEVLAEFDQLLDRGVYEVNLVAQDLANYGKDRGGRELVDLLGDMRRRVGDYRIRLLYIHPDHFPGELPALMAEEPRILPYFDIPFQHADRGVLRRMGRTGDGAAYLDLIGRIRDVLPDAVLRSTFLTGYPGEDRRAFQALRRFQEEARLDWLGVFTYSREEGTKAWKYRGALGHALSRRTANRRKGILETAQQAITEERMDRFVGRELDLLVEEPVQGTNMVLARAWLQAPEVDGAVVLHAPGAREGQVLRGRVVRRNGLDLEAVLREALDG